MTPWWLDTGQVFSFKPAQCSLFWGMSRGQESRFLAIFEKLYSSSGPQKPRHKLVINHWVQVQKIWCSIFLTLKDTLIFFHKSIFEAISFSNPFYKKNYYIWIEVGKFQKSKTDLQSIFIEKIWILGPNLKKNSVLRKSTLGTSEAH